MENIKAYEEIVNFIAAGNDSASIAAFQPSDSVRQRVGELIRKEKNSILDASEASELEHYTQIEHLMRLAKARARQLIAGTST